MEKELIELKNTVELLRTEVQAAKSAGHGLDTPEFKAFETKVNQRIDELQAKVARPLTPPPPDTANDQNNQATAERKLARKVYAQYLRRGVDGLGPDERKVLQAEHKVMTLADDTAAGWMAPVELVREIIHDIVEFSPIRSVARVRETTAKAMQFLRRTGSFAAARTAETALRAETIGLTYGREEIPLTEAYALVLVSKQLLEDTVFDIEAEIREAAAEQFGLLEGAEMVAGTGVGGQCEGILTNAVVAAANVVSGAGALLTAQGLINLHYALPEPYAKNSSWLMRRATIGAIRSMTDPVTGVFMWQPSLQMGQPEMILGRPVVACPDMPAVAALARPVAIGDWKRAYLIGDRVAMDIQRLLERYVELGQIGYLCRKRFNAQVVLPNAIRTQVISV